MSGIRQLAGDERPVELLEVVILEVATAHGFGPERLLALAAMDAANALGRHRYERARVPVGVVGAMHGGSARQNGEGNVLPVTGAQQLVFGDVQRRADEVVRVPVASILLAIVPLRRAEFLEVFDLFCGQGLVDEMRLAAFVAVIHAARVDARLICAEHAYEAANDLPHFVGISDRIRTAEHSPKTRPLRCGTVGFVDQEPVVCHKIMGQQGIEGPALIEVDAEDVGADEIRSLPAFGVLCAPTLTPSDSGRNFTDCEGEVLEPRREELKIIRAGARLVLDQAVDGDFQASLTGERRSDRIACGDVRASIHVVRFR